MDYKTLLKRLTGRRQTAKANGKSQTARGKSQTARGKSQTARGKSQTASSNSPRAKTYRNFINKPRTLTKKIPAWTGTICDPVGFFQHTGQCWLNSMAMMFLNADGLKEFTQQKAVEATLTVSETEYGIYETIFAALKTEYPKNMIWKKVSYRNFKYHMDDFFVHLQNRFRRHYAFAASGVENRVGGQNSLMCEYRAKSALLENWEGPDAGGSLAHTYLLFFVLQSVFQVPLQSAYLLRNSLALTDIFGKEDIEKPTGVMLIGAIHSTCFFTCNGVEYYYNSGSYLQIYQFPYREFLAHYTEGYSLYLVNAWIASSHYMDYPVLIHKTSHVILYDPKTKQMVTDGVVSTSPDSIEIEYGRARKITLNMKVADEVHSMLKVAA